MAGAALTPVRWSRGPGTWESTGEEGKCGPWRRGAGRRCGLVGRARPVNGWWIAASTSWEGGELRWQI